METKNAPSFGQVGVLTVGELVLRCRRLEVRLPARGGHDDPAVLLALGAQLKSWKYAIANGPARSDSELADIPAAAQAGLPE